MEKDIDKQKEVLKDLLNEFHLKPESYLYRYTTEKYIEEDQVGGLYLKAKDEPLDMVVDRYVGGYHVFIAHEIGRGLSFLSKPEKEYQIPGRICVKVKIQDVIDQGGLLYSVSSLPAFVKAFFVTLPEGKVRIVKA